VWQCIVTRFIGDEIASLRSLLLLHLVFLNLLHLSTLSDFWCTSLFGYPLGSSTKSQQTLKSFRWTFLGLQSHWLTNAVVDHVENARFGTVFQDKPFQAVFFAGGINDLSYMLETWKLVILKWRGLSLLSNWTCCVNFCKVDEMDCAPYLFELTIIWT